MRGAIAIALAFGMAAPALSADVDTGLASAETILAGRSAGKAFRVRIRFTDIFKRHGDSWQATYIDVTRTALDAPAS